MSHLRHLGLKNFRVFGDDVPMLSLAPITLVTGANNSGKSSIIKALLLLQKSIQKYPWLEKLDFTGGGHHLGNYGNTFSKGKEGEMIFQVPFPIFFNSNFILELHYVGNTEEKQRVFSPQLIKSKIFDFSSKEKEVLLDVWVISAETPKPPLKSEWDEIVSKFGVKLNYAFLKKLLLPIHEKWSKHKVELETNNRKFKGGAKYGRFLKEGINIIKFQEIYGKNSFEHEDNPKLQLLDDNSISNSCYSESRFKELEHIGTVLEADLTPFIFIEREISYGDEYISSQTYYREDIDDSPFGKFLEFSGLPKDILALLTINLKRSFDLLRKTLTSHLSHLSSQRGNLSRLYQTEGDAFNRLVHTLIEANSPNSSWENNFLNKWMTHFEIGEFGKLSIDGLYEYGVNRIQLISVDGKSKSYLVDLGYGTLQLITILLKILVESLKNAPSNFEDPGKTPPIIIMIEEPEANLHPRWQSLLAEMFVEAAQKFKIQFILETHSEYLIRNLQNLIAQKAIPAEAVQIFYITEKGKVESGSQQVEPIQIAEDGTLDYTKFKSGFFDEQYNLRLSLLNIQREKFLEEFAAAKEELASKEKRIAKLKGLIDEYTEKKDLKKYEREVDALLGGSSLSNKLSSNTRHYFASARFLYFNFDNQVDYSPVIIQCGRAVEKELLAVFSPFKKNPGMKNWIAEVEQKKSTSRSSILTAREKRSLGKKFLQDMENFSRELSFSQMQRSLEFLLKPKFIRDFDLFREMYQFITQRFDENAVLKESFIQLIDVIRKKRDEAGHTYANLLSQPDAFEILTKTETFLKTWVNAKK